MIYLYKILGYLLIPVIKFNIKLRLKNNKEHKSRYKERYGSSNYRFTGNKKTIWIHAASLGEFKSSDYFIKKYSKNYNILVTTTTISAAEYAIKTYNNKIIHQFAPLDINIWINKFLENWKPCFIIWIESDLWPITFHNIKKKKITAILVNLRLSPKSFNRWSLCPSFYNNLLNCFDEIFAQSKLDQERIKILSKRKINFIGNLKFTSLNKKSNYLIDEIDEIDTNYKYLMLASTHSNEEKLLLPVIKNIKKEFKDLRIIIAPRHPERVHEIIDLFSTHNLRSEIYSKNNFNDDKIQIVDTFGMLSSLFNISDIVFLGGSLVSAGGHNPIEPSLHQCAILTASHNFNWENIFEDMVEKKACLKIETTKELELSIKNLLHNESKLQDMKINSFKYAKQQFVDTKSLDIIINSHLDKC